MPTYSSEHLEFIKKKKKYKRFVIIIQILIVLIFIGLWELLARLNIINSFLSSYPSLIFSTIVSLIKSNNLFNHIIVTLYETLLSFLIVSFLGFIIASLFWFNKTLAIIFDPFLTVINSLPKVALGPLIIIWVGANKNSIIFMAIMISLIICIINIYNGFNNVNNSYITLMKSFMASKFKIYKMVIIPSNISNILNTFKINISMCLIGVIMGELLVSKSGLGYLIMYGSQVFNIKLVMTSVFILGIISYLMYLMITLLEKGIKKGIK